MPAPSVQAPPPPANDPPEQRVVVTGKAGHLLNLLVNGDDGERKDAAKKLRDYEGRVVNQALIGALRHDGNSGVRKEAANSLGSLQAREAVTRPPPGRPRG